MVRIKKIRLGRSKDDIENKNVNKIKVSVKQKEIQSKEQIKDNNHNKEVDALNKRKVSDTSSNDTKDDSLAEITTCINKATIKSSQETDENKGIENEKNKSNKQDNKKDNEIESEIKKNEKKKSIFEEEIEKSKNVKDSENEKEIENIKKQDWEDLDAEDEFDPIMVSEYVNDIFEYLREKEVRK